ncbi:MAG: peptidase T [Clostridia bacterium]|nr:peptidase T [Clostridia bacterium]
MKAYERLLNYVVIPTSSDDAMAGVKTPSTDAQWALAKALVDELHKLGVANAAVDGQCYVYATIPATKGCESAPAIGFIAHMDTAPDFCGEGVKPQIITDYDGCDVTLGESDRVLRVSDFPHLATMKGRTLITTDGTTLLGADDKAGVAEIMTFAEEILASDAPHGKICIGFTPDEEIGMGADAFDVARFGADFAYTIDGGTEGEIQFENFNAAGATLTVHGVNVQPGSAKDMMKNAALIGCELQSMLPADEIPAKTEGYEGFFHLTDIEGNVEKCTLSYIIRDHDADRFDERCATMREVADAINQKYGEGTVELKLREQYRNMSEQIKPCYHLIENAITAAKECGIEPIVEPIRGGTDGARLSFMGLPCPNLGTGGYAFHGPFEHIAAEGMDRVVQMIHAIVKRYTNT